MPTLAVIFDMDGVLCDSEPLITEAAMAMFAERGLKVKPEDFHPFVGTGENRFIGGVAETHGHPLEINAAKARTYELYLDIIKGRLQAFSGVKELVQACRQAGLKVAVASSADRLKVNGNLAEIGLPPATFEVVLSGEEVTHKKPAPDIFLLAASQLGVAPENCVVIEDAVTGVQAAQAAGMKCLAVATSFPPARLLAANRVYHRLADITVAALKEVAGPA